MNKVSTKLGKYSPKVECGVFVIPLNIYKYIQGKNPLTMATQTEKKQRISVRYKKSSFYFGS